MLRLERNLEVPNVLRAGSAQRRNAEAAIRALIGGETPPNSKDFAALWSRPAVREALFGMHNGRCCYCERLRDRARESDVEHFRPKTAVSDKSPERPGYWWLAYEWTNLLFACKTCNEEYKKTQFPIRGERAMAPDDSLDDEAPWLLDPCTDDIEHTMAYDYVTGAESVLIYGVGPDGERANRTTRVIGLNRPGLAQERWEDLKTMQRFARSVLRALDEGAPDNYIRRVAGNIRRLTSRMTSAPFVGMRRYLFRAYELGEYVAND